MRDSAHPCVIVSPNKDLNWTHDMKAHSLQLIPMGVFCEVSLEGYTRLAHHESMRGRMWHRSVLRSH